MKRTTKGPRFYVDSLDKGRPTRLVRPSAHAVAGFRIAVVTIADADLPPLGCVSSYGGLNIYLDAARLRELAAGCLSAATAIERLARKRAREDS